MNATPEYSEETITEGPTTPEAPTPAAPSGTHVLINLPIRSVICRHARFDTLVTTTTTHTAGVTTAAPPTGGTTEGEPIGVTTAAPPTGVLEKKQIVMAN